MKDSEFEEKYMKELDSHQKKAVRKTEGPSLLLAVPGSGKTRVIVTRLGYMCLVKGIDPASILTVTYTVAATGEMKSRFQKRFGPAVTDERGEYSVPSFRTINGICHSIIRYYEKAFARTAFEIADESTVFCILRDIYRAENHGGFASEAELSDMRLKFSYIKNMMLKDEEIKDAFPKEKMDVAKCFSNYEKALRRLKKMDFDDQMVYAGRILKKYPDILAAFRKRYRYILVDEAQDTSLIQHEIIRMLAEENNNIFMVGDEDQSIYGFRAAYPKALLDFEKDYPGAMVIFLETNYRSAENIVSAAGRFIRSNTMRREKIMRAASEDPGDVHEVRFSRRAGQYDRLCDIARDTLESGKTVGVLYRNNESALPLVDRLEKEGIAYRIRGFDSSFFTHPAVNDIRNIIKFAEYPYDPEIFMDIYYKFDLKIRKELAVKAVHGQIPGEMSLFDIVAENSRGRQREKILKFQRDLEALKTDRADKGIRRILYPMGYHEFLSQRNMDENKALILEMIGESEESLPKLFERLDQLQQIVSAGNENRDSNFVLSTIHQSKGLEYDRVVLIDAVEGILPSDTDPDLSPFERKKLLEEERRLYYVAMTRAKSVLTIFSYQDGTSRFTREVFSGKAETVSGKNRDLEPGMRIIHRSFGGGTVLSIENGTAEVEFDSKPAPVKIMLSYVLENGVLKIDE